MSGNGNLLQVENLRKWFELRKGLFSNPLYVKAVDDISFSLKKGEAISLVGESGSGKTTLGKTILRLYEPTEGKILVKDKDITHAKSKHLMWYRRETSLIEQDPYGALPSFFTISRILEEPLLIHKFGKPDTRRKRIQEVLREVRLTPIEDFAPKYPHMLSGGQLQRVAVARALTLGPELVVADEPVSMLDASVRIEVLNLLRELQEKKGISFIYITHDLSTTKYFSERLFIMYAGKIVEWGSMLQVIRNPIHPYTQALLKSIPDPDAENRKIFRDVPPGEPPDLTNPPLGCRFHPRCPYKMEICDKEDPLQSEPENKHFTLCWLYRENK
jgi:peptide/nickel transport system ATP-binding protein